MRDAVFVDTAAALVGDADAETWASLEARWHAYGDPHEEALAAIAGGRADGDEAAIARGNDLLKQLGVPG